MTTPEINFQNICDELEIKMPDLARFLGITRNNFNMARKNPSGMPPKHWSFLTSLNTSINLSKKLGLESEKIEELVKFEYSFVDIAYYDRKQICEKELALLQQKVAGFVEGKNRTLAKLKALFYMESNPQVFRPIHLEWIGEKIEQAKLEYEYYTGQQNDYLLLRIEALLYELRLLNLRIEKSA